MASFASSATTGGARQHAWTKTKTDWAEQGHTSGVFFVTQHQCGYSSPSGFIQSIGIYICNDYLREGFNK